MNCYWIDMVLPKLKKSTLLRRTNVLQNSLIRFHDQIEGKDLYRFIETKKRNKIKSLAYNVNGWNKLQE